ncbi:MAG: hypothetical protein R2880_08915 [Deinococcales bacterium]
MSKEAIADFIERMNHMHKDHIEALDLPEGTEAYVAERMASGDEKTLVFMLKLAYIMGLQTGYAASEVERQVSSQKRPDTIKA